MDALSLHHILVDGSIISTALGLLILASLYANPRLWLQDYPLEVRERVPPLSAAEKRQRMLFGVVFLLSVIGSLLLSTLRLRAANGGTLSFGAAWLHVYLLFTMFNLFDTLVVDYLVVTVLRPAWAILPGAEGLEQLYLTGAAHGKGFVRGQAIGTVFCLPIALLATL